MTPQQLIDACRATNQPLPSGRKIAEVVERVVEENLDLQHDLAFEAEGNRFAQAYIGELKQERVRLAKQVQKRTRNDLGERAYCAGCGAMVHMIDDWRVKLTHADDCPVALAERILKEAS